MLKTDAFIAICESLSTFSSTDESFLSESEIHSTMSEMVTDWFQKHPQTDLNEANALAGMKEMSAADLRKFVLDAGAEPTGSKLKTYTLNPQKQKAALKKWQDFKKSIRPASQQKNKSKPDAK